MRAEPELRGAIMLYVQNTVGCDIAAIEEGRWTIRGRASLGEHIRPDDICVSPDGTTLYANGTWKSDHLAAAKAGARVAATDLAEEIERWREASDGTFKTGESAVKTRLHDMDSDRSVFVAFDAMTMTELWRVDMEGHAGHLARSRDGRYVYNALFDRYRVARVDTRTREVTYIPIYFNGGHGMRVSADDRTVYAGSILMGEIDVIDAETLEVTQRVLFPDNVRPFDVTADGRTAYVQLSRLHGFKVVDLAANRISATVELPPLPPDVPVLHAFPHTVDHGLEITPDGTKLITLATTGNYLAVHALPGLELLKVIPVGIEPSWVIVSADGRRAYASNRVSDDLSVIDLDSLTETARFKVGVYPQRLAASAV